MKDVLIVIVIVAGLSMFGILAKVIFFPAHVVNKTLDTGYEVVDQVMTGQNAIYNYEWFKRQKESINAMYGKIGNAQKTVDQFKADAGPRENWTFEDKTESARLNSVVLGLENQTKDMIAEYNARSQMATRDIFKDGLIPQSMEFGSKLLGGN